MVSLSLFAFREDWPIEEDMPCHRRKFGRNWEEVVEGTGDAGSCGKRLDFLSRLPRSGNRMEEAPGREISAQFKEELPVKRRYIIWLKIWLGSQTSDPDFTHSLTLTKLCNLLG